MELWLFISTSHHYQVRYSFAWPDYVLLCLEIMLDSQQVTVVEIEL